jgi:flavin reductase (DIM6/NTAB) family NADH-FMN oxidoreductase RutF
LLTTLRRGRELRHLPVALDAHGLAMTRAIAVRSNGTETPVLHVPVALRPLTFALWSSGAAVEDAVALLMVDARAASSGTQPDRVARIELRRDVRIDLAGTHIVLYRAASATNRFQRVPRRWWTYILASRSAWRTMKQPGGLGMTALELRALDCYYVWPRPVYVVSVQQGNRSNIFPMDLVGPLDGDRFTLALRNTSPSVDTMRASGQVTLSVAPADWKERVYALGAHHRRASIEPAELPFALARSPVFGHPVPDGLPGGREVEIIESVAIGSHTLFMTRTIHRTEPPPATRRLAHVSALFAAWRARSGEPLVEA